MNQDTIFLLICTLLSVICISTTRSYVLFDLDSNDNMLTLKKFNVYSNSRRADEVSNIESELLRELENATPLSFYTKRGQNLFPSVEVGPGAFKTEIIQYPPETLKKQLSNLMRLKKQLEEQMG